MYYKNKENKPYYEPSQTIIKRDGLIEITEDEFNQLVIDINTPTPEQALKQKRAEALKYLVDTDFYYPRYLETGEPVPTDVVIKRQEYRTLLRDN